MSDFEDIDERWEDTAKPMHNICGETSVSHTGGILRIQYQHFVKWPATVRDEFVAFRRIATTTPASNEDGIVEKHETHGTHRLVRCGVEHEDTVHLCNDVPARCRRHEFGRPLNLGV